MVSGSYEAPIKRFWLFWELDYDALSLKDMLCGQTFDNPEDAIVYAMKYGQSYDRYSILDSQTLKVIAEGRIYKHL